MLERTVENNAVLSIVMDHVMCYEPQSITGLDCSGSELCHIAHMQQLLDVMTV